MLKIRKEIECYDKVMEIRPNYPKIWYNLGLGYKQKAKEYVHRSEAINKIRRKTKWKKIIVCTLSDKLIELSERLDAIEKSNKGKNEETGFYILFAILPLIIIISESNLGSKILK